MEEIYDRPGGQPLIQHSVSVHKKAKNAGFPIDEDMIRVISLSHDIGKCHKWYQMRVVREERNKKKPCERHSLLGAYVAYTILRFAYQRSSSDSILAFLVIAHHHTNPNNISKSGIKSKYSNSGENTKKKDRVIDQLNDIKNRETSREMFNCHLDKMNSENNKIHLSTVKEVIQQRVMIKDVRDNYTPQPEKFLKYFSLLTHSDKLASAKL